MASWIYLLSAFGEIFARRDFWRIPDQLRFDMVVMGEYSCNRTSPGGSGKFSGSFGEVRMFDSVLIWAVIAAALGFTIVRTAVTILHQGYEYTLAKDNAVTAADGIVFLQVLEAGGTRQAEIFEAEGLKQAAIAPGGSQRYSVKPYGDHGNRPVNFQGRGQALRVH